MWAVLGHFCPIHGPVPLMATVMWEDVGPGGPIRAQCESCRGPPHQLGSKEEEVVSMGTPPASITGAANRICLRGLCTEVNPQRAAMMVSDGVAGCGILAEFRLGPRQYTIAIMAESEQMLMRHWDILSTEVLKLAAHFEAEWDDTMLLGDPRDPKSLESLAGSDDVWKDAHNRLASILKQS